MAVLNDAQITEAIASLPGWAHRGDRIEKEYVFEGFPDAVAFFVRVAFAAEAADHHPDLVVHYRRLTLAYSTHSEGGITPKDIEGAKTAERLHGGA
jgi:4a-hydroxytetrahydrobiopterin dehydratase